jgi:hypothetical protein
MADKTGSPPAGTQTSALAAVRDLAIIASVYLFFATYIYTQAFYSVFGLRVAPSDLPLQTVVAYSYFVLKPYGIWVVIAASVASGIINAIPASASAIRVGLLVGVGLLLFGSLGALASRRGLHDGLNARQGTNCPIINVAMKAERTDPKMQELAQLDKDGKLRLLLDTKEELYVFAQPAAEYGELPYGLVFSLRKEDILFYSTEAASEKVAGR